MTRSSGFRFRFRGVRGRRGCRRQAANRHPFSQGVRYCGRPAARHAIVDRLFESRSSLFVEGGTQRESHRPPPVGAGFSGQGSGFHFDPLPRSPEPRTLLAAALPRYPVVQRCPDRSPRQAPGFEPAAGAATMVRREATGEVSERERTKAFRSWIRKNSAAAGRNEPLPGLREAGTSFCKTWRREDASDAIMGVPGDDTPREFLGGRT